MTSERFEQFVRWKEFLLRWSKILEWRKAQNSSVSACRTKWLQWHAAMLGGLALIASHRLCFVAHCTCRWFNFLLFLFLVFIVYVTFFCYQWIYSVDKEEIPIVIQCTVDKEPGMVNVTNAYHFLSNLDWLMVYEEKKSILNVQWHSLLENRE